MPKIHFNNQSIDCAVGANLRKTLLAAGQSPYNGAMKALNCHGFGTCGTCAVRVEGDAAAPTKMEGWRLAMPPHNAKTGGLAAGLRLACQCAVQGDVVVTKMPGLWGQKASQ
ncbi:2Fe-2S iron-sulfur cluster binding domain protein [Pirellulimonas nuda]|uniref:2Fe-2S iron-sulfur cluster binding domain protein n=1 Tax=Pirellulimonas nuda TaxID=2528009 RepID=A0A518D9B9_9BACT|nr:2Fe-2S iron-sulfur cluster-binding protein [Pirellulimonas nuda]QDU88072.1 2Fe-2S iron-sulfur cluster binding domain protein [Pirellulimonas nuda]